MERLSLPQTVQLFFWRELALNLKDHPAIVGYNILNEPSPEMVRPKLKDWYTQDYNKWYNKIKGSPADLNIFYKNVINSIRTVDKKTPIIIDTGFYGTPYGLTALRPKIFEQGPIIYSFHSYINYRFLRNKGFKYPGSSQSEN